MNEPRKHHYVPVFYQQKFVNDDGLLWVYDRRRRTFKELSPKVICFQKDLYAFQPDGAPKDQRVESLALASTDGLCSQRMREIEREPPNPNYPTIEAIAYFAGLQSARLPSFAEIVTANYRKGAEEIMRLTSVSVERMKAVMDQYAESSGKEIDVSPESMIEAIRGNHLEVVVTETAFLQSIFGHAEFLAKTYLGLSWEILIASPETGFILTDDPCTVVPPRGIDQVGIVIPGSAKYFPLTRRLCARLGNPTRRLRFRYRSVDRQAVRIINQNLAANSSRFIMGPVREQLEMIVQRSGSTEPDFKPRFTLETVEESENGSTQMLIQNPRRYFYVGNNLEAP